MITCYLKYTIDPAKIEEFEEYGRMWVSLVNRFGGEHLGYFLPHEGANDVAYSLFNFPSLASYEEYRLKSGTDADCKRAYLLASESKCILSYERTFLKPLKSSENKD